MKGLSKIRLEVTPRKAYYLLWLTVLYCNEASVIYILHLLKKKMTMEYSIRYTIRIYDHSEAELLLRGAN